MKVVIHREARAELLAAAKWYGDIRPDLQVELEHHIRACIDRVAASPKHFPSVAPHFRRALVDVFPYEIFFELTATKIKILAVAHSSRAPFYWVERK